jgi:aquaporin rerated protein, other eukaryote
MNSVEAPSKSFMVLPGMSRMHKRRDRTTRNGKRDELRIPLLNRIPVDAKNHIVAMLGEFFGTFMFLFFAFAATNVANASANAQVQAQAQQNGSGSNQSAQTLAQAPQASTLLYISLAFGFSLAVNVWIFFRISGGWSYSGLRLVLLADE